MLSVLLRGIIFAVLGVVFNGEFLAHGLGVFAQPFLFILYFLLISLLDRARAVWNLKYHQIALIGAGIGLLLEGFFARSLYGQAPMVLGISLLVVLAQGFAYGFFATLLPIWVSDLLLPSKKLNPKLEKFLFGLTTLLFLLLLFIWWTNLEKIFVPQSLVIFILSIILFYLAFLFRKKDFKMPNKKSVFIPLAIYLLIQFLIVIFAPALGSLFYGLAMLVFGTIFFCLFFPGKKIL